MSNKEGCVRGSSSKHRRRAKSNASTKESHQRRHSLPVTFSKMAGSYVALTLLSRHPNNSGSTGVRVNDPPPISPNTPHSNVDRPSDFHNSPESRISGPISVDSDKDLEFRSQRISTIRLMYEQMMHEYDKIRMEVQKYPADHQLARQLDEKTRVIRTLEHQLFTLTGIRTESSITSSSQNQRSPQSGLPPPGGTPPQRSTDALDQIAEESGASRDPAGLPPHPPHWLPGGPKHRKTESMPDTMFDEDVPTGGATVRRTHSDSRKHATNEAALKEGASAGEIEKLRTSSLPSSMYEAGSDASPTRSPTTSPPPQPTSGWSEGTTSDNNDDPLSPLAVGGGGGEPMQMTQEPPLMPLHSAPRDIRPLKAVPASQAQLNVMTMEEDEFSSDEGQLEDHGPFGHLNDLKNRPAHLAVFLHYLILNSDPAPLLFYLVSEQYSQGTLKEMRKWAYEIYSTFLHEKAPLLVKLDEKLLQEIEQTLTNRLDKEEPMRRIFLVPRHVAQSETSELLAEFRSRRSMGLGSIYGSHELHDGAMNKAEEISIVERKLWPHFEKVFEDDASDWRNRAMATALATFLKAVGVSTSKGSSALDRCPTFNTKDKTLFKFGSKAKKKTTYTKGHHFLPTFFVSTTFCRHCHKLIWGIGNQAMQCIQCDMPCHRPCLEHQTESCTSVKKDKRKSIIAKMGISRKPSTTNPSAIREALHPYTGRGDTPPPASLVQRSKSLQTIPQSSTAAKRTTFYVQHTPPRSPTTPHKRPDVLDETPDEDQQIRNTHRVCQLVDRYSELANSPELTPPRDHSPSPQDGGVAEMEAPPPTNDVAVEQDAIKALTQSGSSSNSSLSRLDSPSNSTEVLNHANHDVNTTSTPRYYDDSDFETEAELPPLTASIPKDVLRKLKPKEKKRQDVINELFYTERAHMRNLKVMLRLFCQPMKDQVWIMPEFVKLLFPNLDEMTQMHKDLNQAFKSKKQERPVVDGVADILLDRFDGENGDRFKRACATFCGNQSHALELLRNKQRKEPKFATFIQDQASNMLCRRLSLKDYIPTVMQRLVKYPMLTESLLKYSSSNSEEYRKLQQSLKCSKEILDYVNQAVRECENRQKLSDIQKRLDKKPIENSHNVQVREYRNIDLTRKKLIHDGDLTWKIRAKHIDLHMLLLEDILVLLQKQDDRLVLRCQNTMVQTGGDRDTKFTHSPIIKLNTLLIRDVATNRKAFFLISNSELGPQIYELTAPTHEERKKWYKYIVSATSEQKNRDLTQPQRRHAQITPPAATPPSSTTSVPDTPPPNYEDLMANMEDVSPELTADEIKRRRRSDGVEDRSNTEQIERRRRRTRSNDEEEEEVVIGNAQKVEPQIAMATLIEPTEVVTHGVVVEKAAPGSERTPLEQLLHHDRHIEREMEEKKKIVAELLHVPLDEYENIAELATLEEEHDPRSLLLATLHQSAQLSRLSQHAVTAAATADSAPSSLPSVQLAQLTQSLSSKLQQLLCVVEENEAERKRLQHELDLTRQRTGSVPSNMTSLDALSSNMTSLGAMPSNTINLDAMDGIEQLSSTDSPVHATSQSTVKVEHCQVITTQNRVISVERQVIAKESQVVAKETPLVAKENPEVVKDTIVEEPMVAEDPTDNSSLVTEQTLPVAEEMAVVAVETQDTMATVVSSEDVRVDIVRDEELDAEQDSKVEEVDEDELQESTDQSHATQADDSVDNDSDEEEEEHVDSDNIESSTDDEEKDEEDEEEDSDDDIEVVVEEVEELKETLTKPDIAVLSLVESDDGEDSDNVKLEITEEEKCEMTTGSIVGATF